MAGLTRLLFSLGARAAAASTGSAASTLQRGFATEAPKLTRKEIAFMLDAAPLDPEVDAAVKRHQRERFAAASKAGGGALPPAAPPADPALELTSRVERKYMAAQVVESGVLGIAPPVEYAAEGGAAAVKRYAAQLGRVAAAAGFGGDPVDAVSARLDSAAAGAETAREVLARIAPYCAPDFHQALHEALADAEAASGGAAVTLDGASAGYKKFAEKVKAVSQAHKLPWQMLLAHHKVRTGAAADEAQRDALARDYGAWLQSAALVDGRAELDALSAEAGRALDAHLRKAPEAARAEREAAAAALLRRAEAAKGQAWADRLREDLAYVDWFDARVAAAPLEGPKAAAA